jgi:hypothetical protein
MRHMTEISEIKVYIHGLFFYLYLIYGSIKIFFYVVLIYQIKEKGHHLIILLANLKIKNQDWVVQTVWRLTVKGVPIFIDLCSAKRIKWAGIQDYNDQLSGKNLPWIVLHDILFPPSSIMTFLRRGLLDTTLCDSLSVTCATI